MVPPDVLRTWTVGRALVVCGNDAGSGGDCFTNGEAWCPQFVPGTMTCWSVCASNQYGVGYGGPGPIEGPTPPLVSGCVDAKVPFLDPSPTVCCPCQ
jgi:hypothetical protein